jgi:hypothetical protein
MPASPSEASPQSEHRPYSSKSIAPRVFRYVVKHDSGFAPCFAAGACTLACCKPNIRRSAVVGDWVLGFAPRNKGDARLLYAMRVGEVLDFESYAIDPRFEQRPDNIYQPNGSGGFRRVAEHDIHLDPRNQVTDLNGRNVLIADQWWHFEMDGLDLRIALDEAVACRLWYSGRGHKVKGLLPGDLQALVAVLCRQKRGGANSAKIKPRRKGARSPGRCS